MDLLKDIENFRSQALMSRYQKALLLGSNIINQIKLFSSTFHQDFSKIESQIKQEMKICQQISNFLNSKQSSKLIDSRSECKINKSWVKQAINESNGLQQVNKQQVTEQKCSLSSYINQKPYPSAPNLSSIQQQLHKHLILPLNMPLFKLRQTIILLSASNCLQQVVQYLEDYDFYLIKEQFRVEDLGIQNIANIKQQIIKANHHKAIILYKKIEKDQPNHFNQYKQKEYQPYQSKPFQQQNVVQRLVKTIRQYRQFYQQSKQQKQTILVFVIDNSCHKNVSEMALKSIDFL